MNITSALQLRESVQICAADKLVHTVLSVMIHTMYLTLNSPGNRVDTHVTFLLAIVSCEL